MTINIRWKAPSDDGGCPIKGYKLYVDDGNNGAITTDVDPADVHNKAYLNRRLVTFTNPADTGKVFRF